MGNEQSNYGERKCGRCNIDLPTSVWNREQYIEGAVYVVFNYTDANKYFQSVKSPNTYVCSPCFFNRFRDLYDRRREDQICKPNEEAFQLRFERVGTTAVEEDVQAQLTYIVQHTDIMTRELINIPVHQEDSCESCNHSIDRIRLKELTKQTWYEATSVTDSSLQRCRGHLRTSPHAAIYKIVWCLMYMHLYSHCTCIHLLTQQSYKFMILSKQYLSAIVACPKTSVCLKNFEEELFLKSKWDLAWFRVLLIDVYIHSNNVTLDKRLIISHYLSCILNQYLDELASRKEHISFTLCVTKTVISHSLCGEDVREDECILHFIKTMLQVTRSHDTTWKTECKHIYIREKLRLLELQEFSEHFYLIYNSNLWDVDKIEEIMDIILNEKQTKNRIDIFRLIKVHGISPSSDTLAKLKTCQNIKDMLRNMIKDESERPLITIFQQLEKNGYSLDLLNNVKFILFEVRNVFNKICESNIHSREYIEQEVEKHTRSLSRHINLRRFVNVLTSVVYGVHLFIGYRPRDVQLISCILMLLSDEKQRPLLEIRTGEGKSCVIAMVAISLNLLHPGKTVDIVTTSSLLAERDFKEWQQLYKFFGVSFATNVKWSLENGKKKCYQNTVIIGTVETFSADFLRHDFKQTGIRGKRQFQIAIVDEVDSMLLDRGVQFTYLSEDIPGMRHLEPLLAMIWYRVCQFKSTKTSEDKSFFQGSQLAFYQVFVNLFNSYTNTGNTFTPQFEGYINTLFRCAEDRSILPTGFVDGIWSSTTSPVLYPESITKIGDDKVIQFFRLCEEHSNVRFVIHKRKIDIHENGICERISREQENIQSGQVEVNVMLLGNGKVCKLYDCNRRELRDLIQKTVLSQVEFEDSGIETDKFPIPSYFQDLVHSQIPVWICNAIEAMKMQPEREYLIKQDLIFPIDYRFTGMIESNKKWGDGLQQFLEMKHSLALSPMTIITNFISNVAFFRKYKRIYGTTGTLGSEADRDFLRKIYNVSHHSIPTYKRNKMIDNEGIVSNTKGEWLTDICETLNSAIQNRAVLIICEDIKISEEVRQEIENNCKFKKLSLYTRNETDEEMAVKGTLGTGEIVLATNLAGRGTDIKVSDEVNDNGGLFVLITFLPMNERVELQAKGRTARGGNPGSTQIIVARNSKLQKGLSNLRCINDLKRYRKQVENNIMNSLEEEVTKVLKKDNLFNKYCNFMKQIPDHPANTRFLHEILHEKWGIWFKIKSTYEPFEKLKRELEYDIQTILAGKHTKCNMYLMIKMGNSLMKQEKYEEAVKLYDSIIRVKKRWSVLAYYNKAVCVFKRKGIENIKESIIYLDNASKLLQTYFHETTVILACFRNAAMERHTDKNLFIDQAQVRIQVLTFFQETIEQLISEFRKIVERGSKKATIKYIPIVLLLENFKHASIRTCTSVGKELKELRQMGILHFYAIDKTPWYKSDQFFLCVIGISQVAIGYLLIQVSCGTIIPAIATGLIGEGISDMLDIDGFLDPVREIAWKNWGMKKGLSLAWICVKPVGTHYGKMGLAVFKASGENKITAVTAAITHVASTVVIDSQIVKTSICTAKIPLEGVYYGLKKAGKIIAEQFILKVKTKVGIEYIDSWIMDKSMMIIHEQLQKCLYPIVLQLMTTHDRFRSTVQIFVSTEHLVVNSELCVQIKAIFTDVMKERMEQCANNIDWQRNTMSKVVQIIKWAPLNENISSLTLKLLTICRDLLNSTYISTNVDTTTKSYSLRKEIQELFKAFEDSLKLPTSTKKDQRDNISEETNRFLLDSCAHEFTTIICNGIVSIIKEHLASSCFNRISSAVCSILEYDLKGRL